MRIDVEFDDPALLLVALTHQSYLNENPAVTGESNERLEFLGDSALNYIVGRYLYEQLPGLPEGDLTVRRAEAVFYFGCLVTSFRMVLGKFSWAVILIRINVLGIYVGVHWYLTCMLFTSSDLRSVE